MNRRTLFRLAPVLPLALVTAPAPPALDIVPIGAQDWGERINANFKKIEQWRFGPGMWEKTIYHAA